MKTETVMYTLEKTEYDIKIVFEEFILAEEMREWFEESKKLIESMPETFKVMVDMRKMKTLPPDSKAILEEGQKYYISHGGSGSAVISRNTITKEQQRNIATRSGVSGTEVYIDGSQPDWEQKALDWLVNDIRPE
jgi:hypothetical protein